MQIGEPFYLDITANSSEPDTAVSPELKKKMVENFSTEPDNRSFTDDLIQSFKGLTGMGSKGDAPESAISPDEKVKILPDPSSVLGHRG